MSHDEKILSEISSIINKPFTEYKIDNFNDFHYGDNSVLFDENGYILGLYLHQEFPKKIWKMIQKFKFLTHFELSHNKFYSKIFSFTSLERIELRACNIETLSVEILQLTQLKSLYLVDNLLNTLPKELNQLINLSLVDISENQFLEIPKTITTLKNLSSLNINDNQLTSLPKELGNLTNLSSLDIGNNQLTSLPKELGNLTNLSSLDISNNQLTSLPKELGNLTNLSSLDIKQNQLINLPDELGNLTKLSSLDMQLNQLNSIPISFGNLIHLSSLDIRFNQLNDLPTSFNNLINLSSISIAYNILTEIPTIIYTLKNLSSLYIDGNKFTKIPKELANLTNLSTLSIGNNQLTELPKELANLTSLSLLHIDENNFTKIPTVITTLKNLTTLSINNNQLTELPKELANLTNLSTLHLNNNQLTELPKELTNLTSLSLLHIDENNFTKIPTVITTLKNLTTLSISNNQLTELPKELANLANLYSLNISYNNIRVIPSSLSKFNISLRRTYYQKEIIVKNNPLVSPPIELVQQSKEAIKNYFSALKNGEENLNEIKVIFVGDGSSGKTSLIKRLINEDFNAKEPQTHGVRIKDKMKNGKLIHFWDFGGQDIMHSTHQFFLSKRAIYVLVLDNRKDENPEYWLKMIKSFGGDAPIFIVLNKVDQNPTFQVNEKDLSNKYNSIQGYHRLSCSTEEGINNFSEALSSFIDIGHSSLLLDTPIPTTWMNIKTVYDSSTENHQQFNDFHNLCDKNNVPPEHRETLLKFLHELGTLLHFDDTNMLKEYYVLNPRWITDSVYKIVNSKRVQENNGILNTNDTGKILNDDTFCEKEYDEQLKNYCYTPAESEYIISLLKQFRLGFSVTENKVLIPDLLSVQEPNFNIPKTENIILKYEYDFMPASIIPEFIVSMNEDIKDKLRWRSGVVLENKEFNSWALIKSNTEDRSLMVHVTGHDKKEYLGYIRDILSKIHKRFEKIGVKLFIIIDDECQPNPISFEHLKQLEKEGDTHYRPEGRNGTCKKYLVSDLLGSLRTKEDSLNQMMQLILEKLNIVDGKVTKEKIEKEILMLQPNFMGVGMDIKELGKAIMKKFEKSD